MKTFSSYFKELFEKSTQTKASLARSLNLKHQAYIHHILDGKHIPTIENVIKIAQALKCSPTEAKELLLLAAGERTPNDVKEYFTPRHTLNPLWKVSSLERVFFPTTSDKISPILNNDFFSANTFIIESDFLEPIFKKKQKVLVAEYKLDSPEDHKCFEFEDFVIVNYGETGSSEPKFCWGKLVKKEKTTWSIQDPKSEETSKIELKDIIKIAKIIGTLF